MKKDEAPPPRRLASTWPEIVGPSARAQLADALATYARTRRWFRGKSRPSRAAHIVDVIPLDDAPLTTRACWSC